MKYYSLNDKMEIELDESLKFLRILTDKDGKPKDPPDELLYSGKMGENAYQFFQPVVSFVQVGGENRLQISNFPDGIIRWFR